MNEQEIVQKTKEWMTWWVEQRLDKLRNELSDTMSVNPFVMPFLFAYHDLQSFEEYVELIVGAHLMTGHNTGFGKLVDEKLLPNVFGAQKLDKGFRVNTSPFADSCFDEIDHVIRRPDGRTELLSLKAGRWTIQLTMAVQLNRAFEEILSKYPEYDDIVVGVFYGSGDNLTDKYDIIRGINRGAKHNVIDLQKQVRVYAGRQFWQWLSGGLENAQECVLEGITAALREANIHEEATRLLTSFKRHVSANYGQYVDAAGRLDAVRLLSKING